MASENNFVLSESSKGFFFKQEEEYFLTDILDNGGCMWCLNKRCKNTSIHGIPFSSDFPEAKAKYILDIFSKYVSKPTYANGIHTIFKNHKFEDQFDQKKIIFAICDYFKGNCSNCYENRIQKIKINDADSISVCYPSMKVIRSKVTIGLHANIRIVFKGAKYEVSLIPMNVQPSNKILTTHKEPRQYKKDYVDIKEMHEKDIVEKEIWPSLCSIDTKFISPKSVVDYTKIKENINNELEQKSIQREEEIPIVDPVENDELYWQKKLNEKLFSEMLDLENIIKQLKSKIFELENNNKKDKSICANKDIYNEILRNIKTIGNKVSEQILETEYREYMLL